MRRLSRPAVVVLILATGLLPVSVSARALPLDRPDTALRLEIGTWLGHLTDALGALWKKATAETGMSIDPDGRPATAPEDPGADTGKSIDPDG